MLGERYLATRKRLSHVIARIVALAADTGADLAGQLSPAEISSGLNHPFLMIVCGEVNSGKSTLLNGLFGHEFCKVNLLPETRQVICYRHGASTRHEPLAPLLEARYLPLGFLRDFNPIDTPGTNSDIPGLQPVIAPLLATADLILCVFPVSNPWGAATWNFISHMPKETLGRLVLILQQIDQRAPSDITVILGHLRDLSLKRIGHVPPVFAVSAKLACDARRSLPPNENHLADSGYPALEEFISRNVCDAPSRMTLLDSWRAKAAAALRSIDEQIETHNHRIHAQGNFLEDIEREIDAIREQSLIRLPRHLAGVAQAFQSEAVGVANLLHKRLGVARSVFRILTGDHTSQEMEAVFIARLQVTVGAIAEADGDQVVDACRQHWMQLGGRVWQTMGVTLGDPVQLDAALATARSRFVQCLGNAARQGIGNLKVRNQLGKDLRRRNDALKAFTFVALLLLCGGATCGALALAWAPLVLCGLSLVFFISGLLIGWLTRKSLVTDFQKRLLDTCGSYARTLQTNYEEALRIVFQDYADSLAVIRRHLASQKQELNPRQKCWEELFLTLKAIEQEL